MPLPGSCSFHDQQVRRGARCSIPDSIPGLLLGAALAACFLTASAAEAATINGHTVMLDAGNKIIPWTADPAQGYGRVVDLAWGYLLTSVPNDSSNHQPAYYSHCFIYPDTQQSTDLPHNPAGLYAMLTESALKYYGYAGNSAAIGLAENVATALLNNGMTPASWNWGNVPYASGDSGSLTYHGASYGDTTGVGDGTGVIEPDKVGEMGYAWLQLFRFNNNILFRDAAIAAADALASHVRAGSATRSPWPFRVYAQTGTVREEYCANVIGAIALFDELIRLGLGNTAVYQTARDTAWNWMMTYPMQNNVWANYFEDVAIQQNTGNLTQYSALMAARYLLEHPDYDGSWESHVRGLLAWVESTFAVPAYGANSIAEQIIYWYPMGSHTARYASVNALLYEKTGDVVAKEKAYRALNWATYMTRPDGVVIVGTDPVVWVWFTDGYGDYVRHFMTSLGAIPEWSPLEQDHLVRSSSIVQNISYLTDSIAYITADERSIDVLRVSFTPTTVTVDGQELGQRADLDQAGWTFDVGSKILRIRHDAGTSVQISHVLAPNAPIVSGISPTNTVMPTWTWTSGGNGNGIYRYRLDNSDLNTNAATTTATNYTAPPQTEGSHTLYVQERNAAGTWSSSGSCTILIDTTAPDTTILSRPLDPTNQTNASFSFSATETGSVFECRIDAGSYAVCTSPRDYSGLASNQTHTFSVRAIDRAGNVDATPAASSWTIDTIPPSAPAVSGTTPTNDTTPTWTWTTGGNGNGTYRYRLDNSNLTTGAATTTATSYTALAQTEGTHTLSVQERDAAGNWSVSGSFAISIDTTAPPAPIVSSATPTNDTTPTWTWTPGGGGNGTYRYKLDNSDLSTAATTTISTTFTPIAALSENVHTLYVQEQDAAGNWSGSGSFAIAIDITPPETNLTNEPANPTNQTSASFSFTSSEAGSTFTCRIDNQSDSTCTSPATYTGLATNQTHTFSVRAIDPAGNTDNTPATWSWAIETSALGMTISTTASDPTRTSPVPLTVIFTKPVEDFIAADVNVVHGVMTSGSFSGSGTTYMFSVTPASDGIVTISVAAGVAHDAASNPNGAVLLSITYDTVSPSTPVVSSATPTNDTTPTWTWTPGGGGNGTYRYKLDNSDLSTAATTTISTTFTPTAALSENAHTLYVQEQDAAGNWSGSGSFAIAIDTTLPETNLTNEPANPTNQTSANFSFTSSEAGSSFECRIDNNEYASCTSPRSYSGLAGDQTHTFQVRAVDPAGNRDASSAAYSWVIDATSPNAPNVSGSAITNDATPTWTWTPGGGGIGAYRYKLDNSDLTTGASTTTATDYIASIQPEGSHTLYVQERDDVGNWSNTGSFAITVDTIAPHTTITSRPSDPTNQTSAGFSFSSNEAGSSFECRIDAGAYSACASPLVYSNLASGQTHTFSVRATDPANNTETAPATCSWLIDTSAAVVTISTTASNPTRTSPLLMTIGFSRAMIGFDANDIQVTNGTISNFIGNGTIYTCAITPIVDGEVIVRVPEGAAQDAAGNGNKAGQYRVTFDTIAPYLVISAPSLTSTEAGPVVYSVTFNGAETITLAPADIILNATGSANAAVTVSGSGTLARTITLSDLSGNGTLSISIPANVSADAAGNTSVTTGPGPTVAVENNTGDFDKDGMVTITDALKALRILAGLDALTPNDLVRGDVAPIVNSVRRPDGKIDAADVVAILRKAAGLSSWQ